MKEIFHRTSVRKFADKVVEEEKVEKLMRAAMAAPSAGNQQPGEYYIVSNPEVLEKLATCSPYAGPAAKAPMAVVCCYRNEGLRFPEYAHIDMAIASQNIMLEADGIGLGSVMLGIAPEQDRMDKVKEILQLPDSLTAFTIIPVGYPDSEAKQNDRYDESRIHHI